MMSYNLLNTAWINVRYLSGEIKEIGIRKAFMDADKIFDITPPVFHKDRAYIYDVLVYKLLASIVMSAYYKEETGYASKNLVFRDELISGDLYNDVIKAYLDKYEDRFDLYSETHPFLQNINLKNVLKGKNKNDSSFKSYSLLVPAANSPVFGKYRSLDTTKEKVWEQYGISDKEFAYIVLYHAVMGRASLIPIHIGIIPVIIRLFSAVMTYPYVYRAIKKSTGFPVDSLLYKNDFILINTYVFCPVF